MCTSRLRSPGRVQVNRPRGHSQEGGRAKQPKRANDSSGVFCVQREGHDEFHGPRGAKFRQRGVGNGSAVGEGKRQGIEVKGLVIAPPDPRTPRPPGLWVSGNTSSHSACAAPKSLVSYGS